MLLNNERINNMKSIDFSKLIGVLKSRKFWAALIGTIFVFLEQFVPDFPLSAEDVTNFVYLLVAYILGVAIEDAGHGIGEMSK